MRICLICTEKLPVPPVRGGAIQTYIDGVLPHLAARHEVTVICRCDPALPDEGSDRGARFVRVMGGEAAVYYRNVADALRREPAFDLVVIYNRPIYVPLIAEAAPGATIVLSMHNDMFGHDRLPPADARAILGQVGAVVTISDYVRRTIDRLHPGYGAKLHTVRSGVNVAAFRPPWLDVAGARAARLRLGLRPDAPVVLHVSRFSPKKGNDLVIRAMAAVLQQVPNAQLLMVGSSRYGSDELEPYGRWLRREAEATLGEAVRFTGFVAPADLPEYFRAGDLFVCASQWEEPLARVHYEAMAAGLPIITTDRGGNAEVVAEGANGFFARPHDSPAAFAALIIRLLADPALGEALGREGRRQAEEQHTWDRVAARLLAVLEGGG